MIDLNFIKNLSVNIGGRNKKEDVVRAAKSIDDFGLFLMHKFGKNPEGSRHFNNRGLSFEQKSSIEKMVDLGIVTFESQVTEYGFEYAYHWTKFGDKVMRYLGVLS